LYGSSTVAVHHSRESQNVLSAHSTCSPTARLATPEHLPLGESHIEFSLHRPNSFHNLGGWRHIRAFYGAQQRSEIAAEPSQASLQHRGLVLACGVAPIGAKRSHIGECIEVLLQQIVELH